jgi:hypothetical protein
MNTVFSSVANPVPMIATETVAKAEILALWLVVVSTSPNCPEGTGRHNGTTLSLCTIDEEWFTTTYRRARKIVHISIEA